MKNFGIVSYNIYCNFTNYGSALQSWALSNAVDKLGDGKWQSVLVDYCPDILADKNPLDPMKNMWDTDEQSRKMCEMSLPAIRANYEKFNQFYNTQFNKTKIKYTADNFNDIVSENIDGFVCGSDTIFCIDEFGLDDGYYANYDCMKNKSVAYAASFGDSHFTAESFSVLNERLKNFRSIALRESTMVDYVMSNTTVNVQKVIDPTLLLTAKDYEKITAPRLENDKYILLYARRYNKNMSDFAEKIANENGWKIIEISLRATNAEKHRMFYDAGIEEFLSLVKNAELVITNSFHGAIFSVQFERPFYIFSREQCDTKIVELLDLFGISDRLMTSGNEELAEEIDYVTVHKRISVAREKSLEFLNSEMEILNGDAS